MNVAHEDRAVARLAEMVSLSMGYSQSKAKQIGNAAALHDIGKQRIDARLLNKPGKLTQKEFDLVKTHTKIGAEMLSTIQGELGEMARTICLYHHEKWDASGYWGIRAGDLPEYVSIVSISDVFIACCSARPYKSAWPPRETLDYIYTQAGIQFSPGLVDVFIPLIQSDIRIPAVLFKEIHHNNFTHEGGI
jgi:putative two-component system response regulator